MFSLTQTLLTVVIVILTTIFTAIGVQIFLLLKEARGTIHRANSIIDQTGTLIDKISHPTASINNLVTGLKEGVKIVDAVSGIFNKNKKSPPVDYEDV